VAYATITDVNAFFPLTSYSADTPITQAEIEQWLTEDSSYIDQRISKSVDITQITTAGAEILKTINAKLTAHRIDEANPTFNARTQDQRKKLRDLRKEALEMLEMVEKKDLIVGPLLGTIGGLFVGETAPEVEFPKDRVL
jgi:hypothetical protein